MRLRNCFVLIVLGAIWLFAAGAWARSQAGQPPTPMVISGADVGFQVDSWNGTVPTGRWVVRSPLTAGKWIEPQSSNRLKLTN